ncbi:hypothetical protein ACFE04_027573 [Oxalis oulophora]
MSSSLEELLAKEGFRGRTSTDSSSRQKTMSVPRYLLKDKPKSCSPPAHSRIKTQRTNSDPFRYPSKGGLPRSGSSSSNQRSRDSIFKREMEDRNKKDYDLQERIKSNIAALENETVELDYGGNEIIKDTDSDNPRTSLDRRDMFLETVQGKERSKDKLDQKKFGRFSGELNSRNSMKKSEITAVTSNEKSIKGLQAASSPAIDEAAIQALISILTGHIKKYLKDSDFRDSLRQSCFSLLSFVNGDDLSTENNVVANLADSIESIERAAQKNSTSQELKAASLQLSVITGLNSNDFKDGFTSGISNSKLSACAHIYLSILYKMQKKDKVSAKHLLQVFCDTPYQARKILLPELWDYLFSPHLFHLKTWYEQEASSLTEGRKVKILEKAYNEILDSGTYQFAVYYKDWLMEGVEAPSLPYISVSSLPVAVIQQEGSFVNSSELESYSPSPTSPQPMVSKKLYAAVFGRSSKPGVHEVEEDSSADSPYAEIKEALTYSSTRVEEGISTKMVQNDAFSPEDSPLSTAKEISTKGNGLTLRRLAKSAFDLDRIHSSKESIYDTVPIKLQPFLVGAGSEESWEYSDEGSIFTSIPQDFICPLTGQMFEDPVTLESGQTFERAAIKKWFGNGNKTCPVSGKSLECNAVPYTNFILKRVIDSWKQMNTA